MLRVDGPERSGEDATSSAPLGTTLAGLCGDTRGGDRPHQASRMVAVTSALQRMNTNPSTGQTSVGLGFVRLPRNAPTGTASKGRAAFTDSGMSLSWDELSRRLRHQRLMQDVSFAAAHSIVVHAAYGIYHSKSITSFDWRSVRLSSSPSRPSRSAKNQS